MEPGNPILWVYRICLDGDSGGTKYRQCLSPTKRKRYAEQGESQSLAELGTLWSHRAKHFCCYCFVVTQDFLWAQGCLLAGAPLICQSIFPSSHFPHLASLEKRDPLIHRDHCKSPRPAGNWKLSLLSLCLHKNHHFRQGINRENRQPVSQICKASPASAVRSLPPRI